MRLPLICTAALAALSLSSTAALAQAADDTAAPAASAAPAVHDGDRISSSDGWTIGRVESVQKGKDGASYASVIYQMRMVYIPVDSLSAGPKGLVTKLSRAEVTKLK